MNIEIKDRIYDRKDKLEQLLSLLEKGIENLSDQELKMLEALLRDILPELPELTRTGVEKRELYRILKSILEDLRVKIP